jgi:hypothetical protein
MPASRAASTISCRRRENTLRTSAGSASSSPAPLLTGPPLKAQALADLDAQVCLVEVAGGLGVLIQLPAIQRGPAPIRAAGDVRAHHMRMQLRIKRPRHPMAIGGGDQAPSPGSTTRPPLPRRTRTASYRSPSVTPGQSGHPDNTLGWRATRESPALADASHPAIT